MRSGWYGRRPSLQKDILLPQCPRNLQSPTEPHTAKEIWFPGIDLCFYRVYTYTHTYIHTHCQPVQKFQRPKVSGDTSLKVLVAQSCLTLCNPMDCNLPGSSVHGMAKNTGAGRHSSFLRDLSDPWAGKMPWRRKWQPTPIFLAGKSYGWRRVVGYSAWNCKESSLGFSRQEHRSGFPIPSPMHGSER